MPKNKGDYNMDIKSYRQKKERGASVRQLAEELLKEVDQFESILIVGLDENKEMLLSYSTDSNGELIGVMEAAKSLLVEDILASD